jgi:hypothetical protein
MRLLTYTLDNGEERHAAHPDTFEIPDREERHGLRVGDDVKLVFNYDDTRLAPERMWVTVTSVSEGPEYTGALFSEPLAEMVTGGMLRDRHNVAFRPCHVIDIWDHPAAGYSIGRILQQ